MAANRPNHRLDLIDQDNLRGAAHGFDSYRQWLRSRPSAELKISATVDMNAPFYVARNRPTGRRCPYCPQLGLSVNQTDGSRFTGMATCIPAGAAGRAILPVSQICIWSNVKGQRSKVKGQ